MKTTEIRIGGFGGQGVILSGLIIGKAASIYDEKFATMIQSFGPEARGSACSAQLTVSGEPILYPYVTLPEILVVMSQEAYDLFSAKMKKGGTIVYEEELVTPKPLPEGAKTFSIPATRLAEELGRKIVLNIVMTGFFTAVTKLVSYEAMKKAVEASVPKGTESLNLGAFEKGYQYGLEQLKPQSAKK